MSHVSDHHELRAADRDREIRDEELRAERRAGMAKVRYVGTPSLADEQERAVQAQEECLLLENQLYIAELAVDKARGRYNGTRLRLFGKCWYYMTWRAATWAAEECEYLAAKNQLEELQRKHQRLTTACTEANERVRMLQEQTRRRATILETMRMADF